MSNLRQIIPKEDGCNELQAVLQKRRHRIDNRNENFSQEHPHTTGHKTLKNKNLSCGKMGSQRRRGSKKVNHSNNLQLLRQQFEQMGNTSKQGASGTKNNITKIDTVTVSKPEVIDRGRKPTLKPRPPPKKPPRLKQNDEVFDTDVVCRKNLEANKENKMASYMSVVQDAGKNTMNGDTVRKEDLEESDSDYEDVGGWEDAEPSDQSKMEDWVFVSMNEAKIFPNAQHCLQQVKKRRSSRSSRRSAKIKKKTYRASGSQNKCKLTGVHSAKQDDHSNKTSSDDDDDYEDIDMAQISIRPNCTVQNQIEPVVSEPDAVTKEKIPMQKPKPPIKPRLKKFYSQNQGLDIPPVPPDRTTSMRSLQSESDIKFTENNSSDKKAALKPLPKVRNRSDPTSNEAISVSPSRSIAKKPAEFENVTFRERTTSGSSDTPSRPPRPKTSIIGSQTYDEFDYDDSMCTRVSDTVPRIPPKQPTLSSHSITDGLVTTPRNLPPPCQPMDSWIPKVPIPVACIPTSNDTSELKRTSPSKNRENVESDVYIDPFKDLASHPQDKMKQGKPRSSQPPSVPPRRQGSMFQSEPLYQVYIRDKQNRDLLQASFTEDAEVEEDDDVYEDTEVTGGHMETHERNQSVVSLASLAENKGGMRTLWSEIPEVRDSGILQQLTDNERKLKEALFEIITSEASYYRSLEVLLTHFCNSSQLAASVSKRDRHILFSNLEAVYDVSKKLLEELEDNFVDDLYMSFDVYEMLTKYANDEFTVYVTYCRNQTYQDRKLLELLNSNSLFKMTLRRLEIDPICQSQEMRSFLILPMQRITRLPLLLEAVAHRMEPKSAEYPSVQKAVQALNRVVKRCNDEAKHMGHMEEVNEIHMKLDFKNIKTVAIVSKSRYLIKKGQLTRINKESTGLLSKKQEPLNLYLFNDLLIITKKKGDNQYTVLDYAARIHVHADIISSDKLSKYVPTNLIRDNKNCVLMALLENHENKESQYILSCTCTSEATRWAEAVTPPAQENEDEKIYEAWDCPQVQAVQDYTASQSDELSLEESDIINVFRKMADGMYEGERIRDGERGWFPSSYTVEIQSRHVRAKNLRQRYRLLLLSGQMVGQVNMAAFR